MIASTLVAAALASTNPAQAAPAPAAAHDQAAMAGHQGMPDHKDMAGGKMDCCKDGCACCAKKDAPKAEAAPAR
ncbi:MAG: hypothetical protein M3Q57_00165 [Pseudomonadota bacterium]|nr:hypothetical protein [Pseudomonadota bacterium]